MKKIFLSFFSVAIGCVGVANAAVYTWSGAAGDNMWGNSQNWDLKNGYYPQSNSDTAIILPGNEVIVWSSTQGYLGDTASINLGAGNTVRFEANHATVDLDVSSFTLGGGSMFKLFGSNAIGYGKNFTINYGTFTADSHGLFDANMGGGVLWTNGKTVTLTGNFDATGLAGSGSITLYDASQMSHGGGAAVFDVSGISMTKSDNVDVDIVTSGNKVVINYTVAPAVPEPTTATLSLLALAGVMVRRRRR